MVSSIETPCSASHCPTRDRHPPAVENEIRREFAAIMQSHAAHRRRGTFAGCQQIRNRGRAFEPNVGAVFGFETQREFECRAAGHQSGERLVLRAMQLGRGEQLEEVRLVDAVSTQAIDDFPGAYCKSNVPSPRRKTMRLPELRNAARTIHSANAASPLVVGDGGSRSTMVTA